jgi:hypothetical protein
MSWSDLHTQSEQLAEEAHNAMRSGDLLRATQLFAEAARLETSALDAIESNKPRTFGITAVSAVALLYKAGELQAAERLAYEAAARPSLSPESRKLISETLRGPSKGPTDAQIKEETILHGVLRALDLDNDWLEIVFVDGQHRKIRGVGEAIDDVIGPMVNHNVIVRTRPARGGSLKFIDIEVDE